MADLRSIAAGPISPMSAGLPFTFAKRKLAGIASVKGRRSGWSPAQNQAADTPSTGKPNVNGRWHLDRRVKRCKTTRRPLKESTCCSP